MRGAVRRPDVQRGLDQLLHAFIVDRVRPARVNIGIEAGGAPLDEPLAPLAHRGLGQIQPLGNRKVGLTISTAQSSRARAASGERHHLRALLVRQHQISLLEHDSSRRERRSVLLHFSASPQATRRSAARSQDEPDPGQP